MKKAILYVRVATSGQTVRNGSLSEQENELINFCVSNNIEVEKIFLEVHSANDFNRPEFLKMLRFIKQNQGGIDLLLFTSWDRFSRNPIEAFQMLESIKLMGVESKAIIEPLDNNLLFGSSVMYSLMDLLGDE